MNVTAIVHTRNSEATLDRALGSLAWAAELIVVDMGSTDRTYEVAARHNARIVQTPEAPRVDGIRNRYLAEANHDWIFVLDSDEYLAEDAAQSIEQLLSQHSGTFDAFAIPRFNEIGDQILRGSGWYPDHQIRFFRRGMVEWSDTIHCPPRVVSGLHRLHHLAPPDCLHIHHRNYRDLGDFIQRQVTYALNDRHATDPAGFELSDVLARAYRELSERRDVAVDGDLSQALAWIMAWDQVIRGLLLWERLEPRPPLGTAIALPIAAARLDPVVARRRSRRLRLRTSLRSFLSRYPKLFAVFREARRRMQTLRGSGPKS